MDNNLISVWTEVLSLLEDEISTVGYNTWIKSIKPQKFENGNFYVEVPTSINKNMIDKRYNDLIKNALLQVTGVHNEILVSVKDETAQTAEKPVAPVSTVGTPLNPKYTFDTFVVGKSNSFAQAACLAVAESPGTFRNPLFLYSGVGLGKTHLLHAIGNYIKENNNNAKIAYISSETFTIELINSIRDRKMEDFRNKYRSIDVLMVDDIQFIAGKIQTEEEFFHTFNTLHDANKQIIITSDKPPDEIKQLEERLRSRFEWGLMADIALPDFETRVAILKKKADEEGVIIPENILMYIAEMVTSNIRELEGLFNKVLAYRSLEKKEISMEVAMEALKYYEKNSGKKSPDPDKIIENCSKYFQVRKEDITGTRRTKEISEARQVSMYFMREILGYSSLKIAKYLNKDHSTVIYGIKKIETDMKADPEYKIIIEKLKDDIIN